MAVIPCPECTANVSDKALNCPSCGFQLKKLKRGFFGKTFKLLFILFNILMVVWLFSALSGSGEVLESAQSDAERAGAAIGTGIGIMFLAAIWAMGDIILGLFVMFTRPKA